MWKRDEAVKPAAGAAPTASQTAGVPSAAEPAPTRSTATATERTNVNIGKSVVIKGELNGSEDLTIEGQVEGKIELKDHILTVGATGQVHAHIIAKSIIVLGQVTGNVTANEKVDIREKGSVDGDIVAPRVAIADGADFRGRIDMRRKEPAATNGWTVDGLEPDARTTTPANGASVSV